MITANCYSCLLRFLWKTEESPKRMKCISVPVVDDRTCRELFPMHWSYGMFCAGQVDGTNCLVRIDMKGQTCARLLWNPMCCLLLLQDDRGAVMECDGQLQGIQWYSFGCTNAPDPSTYSNICQYTRWMKDVIRNNSPTSPPTLPPTTPPSSVKEDADAEGLQSVQGSL